MIVHFLKQANSIAKIKMKNQNQKENKKHNEKYFLKVNTKNQESHSQLASSTPLHFSSLASSPRVSSKQNNIGKNQFKTFGHSHQASVFQIHGHQSENIKQFYNDRHYRFTANSREMLTINQSQNQKKIIKQFQKRTKRIEIKENKSVSRIKNKDFEDVSVQFLALKHEFRKLKKEILEKDSAIQKLERQNIEMKRMNEKFKHEIQKMKQNFAPYIANYALLNCIQQNLNEKNKQFENIFKSNTKRQLKSPHHQTTIQNNQEQFLHKYLMKQLQAKQQFRIKETTLLKNQLDLLVLKCEALEKKLAESKREVVIQKNAEKQAEIHYPQRQRLYMCMEELQTYKIKFHQSQQKAQKIEKYVLQLKEKIKALTSLLGCTIWYNQNERAQIRQFSDKIQVPSNIFPIQVHHFKMFKTKYNLSSMQTIQQHESKENWTKNKRYKKLYSPRFLVFLGEDKLTYKDQQNLIKPYFFLNLRYLLDSLYLNYRLYLDQGSNIQEFFGGFLKSFSISEKDKKINLRSRKMSEEEIKFNLKQFIINLNDKRLSNLPEIITFREFLLENTNVQQDEMYFYLLCRNKILSGSETQDYISNCDPSKYVKYSKIRSFLIKITSHFGVVIQNMFFEHLNSKIVTKKKENFLKVYYILRVLLNIYQKYKLKKIEVLSSIFSQILNNSREKEAEQMSFYHFSEIIKTNFDFITRQSLMALYKQSLSVYQSQINRNDASFFECFYACCGSKIFLSELLRLDKTIEAECIQQIQIHELIKFKTKKEIGMKDQKNLLNELWPDSVYNLGSQRANKQYAELMKVNQQNIPSKLQVASLLIKIMHGQYLKKQSKFELKDKVSEVLNSFIFNMIDILNKIEKDKVKNQNLQWKASSKLGKFFKKKIHQFYHELIEDIDNVKNQKQKKNQNKYRQMQEYSKKQILI